MRRVRLDRQEDETYPHSLALHTHNDPTINIYCSNDARRVRRITGLVLALTASMLLQSPVLLKRLAGDLTRGAMSIIYALPTSSTLPLSQRPSAPPAPRVQVSAHAAMDVP
jgi:hypothetical protein